MSFSYSKLKNQCQTQKQYSLTSNAKYILPDNPLYYLPYTKMMYYPGYDNLYNSDANKTFQQAYEPEQIKAYKIPENNIKNNHPGFCSKCNI